MAITDSRYSRAGWANAPAYAGGDVQTADAGAADTLDREKAKLQGDPQFAGDVASLDRQRARLQAGPSANANKLLSMVQGDGGDAPPAPSDKASKLLSLVQGGKSYEEGDPGAGRGSMTADPTDRQRQADIDAAPPGWLTAMRARHPTAAKLIEPTVQPFIQPKQQQQATGRGIVEGGLGALGSLDDAINNNPVSRFIQDTGPKLPDLPGARPNTGAPIPSVMPNPQKVGQVLDAVGTPNNPAWNDYREGAQTGAGMIIPGQRAVSAGVGAADNAVGRGIEHVAGGGKAGQVLSDARRGAEAELSPYAVHPEALPGVRVPEPAPGQSMAGLPGTVRGQAASPTGVTKSFENLVEKHNDVLQAGKQKVRADLEATFAKAKAPNLQAVKDELEHDISLSSGQQQAALRRLLNDIHEKEADSPNTFVSMDLLRRQINEAAKQGQDVTGYAAIGANNFRKYADMFKDAMVKAHKPYGQYLEGYTELSKASEPGKARFLSSVGAKEGAEDTMALALKSPDNIDKAIAATGGDARIFDGLAAKRTMREVKDMSPEKLETWISDNQPMLNKLPETAKAVRQFRTQLNAETAQASLAKATGKSEQEGAALASKYRGSLIELQQALSPGSRAAAVRSTARMMRDDGIIDDTKYEAFLKQVGEAEKSREKAVQLANASKYLLYAAGAGYLTAFGGPNIIKAIAAHSQ
jgi:hypothetical protein